MSYDDHTPLTVPFRVGYVRSGLRRLLRPAGPGDTAELAVPVDAAGPVTEPETDAAGQPEAAAGELEADASELETDAGEPEVAGEAEGLTTAEPEADTDEPEVAEPEPAGGVTLRFARHARATEAGAAAIGQGFSRLTLVPVLLVIAWLLPAVPLLLAGSFALAPMLVISIPLALVLIVIGLRQLPDRWPSSAQAQPGPGARAPWWSLLGSVAVAAVFAAWQIAENSQQLVVTRDPGTSLQFGYWLAQHGSVSIPVQAAAFGGVHPGLVFGSTGFVQQGASLSAQFLAGLPSVLAAGFWAGGIHAALLVPPVLGALAVLTFAGLVGRLAGPRWAPAGAVVLALALPEQYTSRAPFSEPLVQILLLGGLCLLIDSLTAPASSRARAARWWLASPSPRVVLAVLGGLALGLTATVQVDGLTDALPAIPVIGVMLAARRPQALPFGAGLVVGAGYGLAAGYVLARPYLDSQSSSMRTFGIIAAAVIAVTAGGVLWAHYGRDLIEQYWQDWPGVKRMLAARPLRWLPEAAAALTLLALVGFAIRPYVQTVRANSGPSVTGYVGYLQRVAGVPLDPTRTYAEDTLYWVIWYIGLPAVLLGAFGLAMLARRVLRALITWNDPDGAARIWALPLLIVGWVTVTVLWRPGTVPDQPWASRQLVPVVLPGLILAAVWAAAWLTGRAGVRGAGNVASSAVAVLSVGALLLPTALTTFGVGVTAPRGSEPISSAAGLAFQRTGAGQLAAVNQLCVAIGSGASVVIVDPRLGNRFTQLIRGACDTPTARVTRSNPFEVVPVLAGIQRARRRAVLLGATRAELAAYGGLPREIVNLTTRQDAHDLTRPPTTTWPDRYTIWMSQPGGG